MLINNKHHITKRIILGIDPGLSLTGFSILHGISGNIKLKECGYLPFCKTTEIQKKIKEFYDFFTKKITEHSIQEIAIETSFLGKSATSFLKLGYLRSIIYLIAEQHELIIHEFSPRTIKQAITGYGNAEKEQIKRAITMIFPHIALLDISKYDITDAISIAICGLWNKK